MNADGSILFTDRLTEEVIDWRQKPASPSLDPGGVHLWRVSLDGHTDESMGGFADSLSADEHARASRYRFEIDRRRFVAGRGILRRLLGSYLAVPPAEIAFAYSRWGRPSVANNRALQFNVTHCQGLYLLAVSAGSPVGIDVEKLDLSQDYLGIAADCFSPEQVRLLNTCPEESRAAVFFRAWTGLEASCKVSGVPLSGEACGSQPIVLRHYIPAIGHVAALAIASEFV